jgi:hypothetical protein
MEDHRGGGGGIKCPMCNGISNVFVRIFIDLNAMNETTTGSIDDNDNDNASLSSVESSSSYNRDGSKKKEAPKDNSNYGSNFVDLVNDNDENSTNINNKHHHRRRVQKYKRKGKALKKSIEEFKSKQLQCNEEIMQLEAKYRLAHTELRAFQAEQDDLVYEDIEVRRELEGTRLACITATRELEETKASITRLQQELATAQSNLDEYTKNHKLNVAKAYAQSMNQADEILAKHPKAMQQRSTLRKENEELRTQLDILQKVVHGAAAAAFSKSRSSTVPPFSMAPKTMKRMHGSSTAPTVSSTASQPAPHRASATAAPNRRDNARAVISQEEGERDENQTQATQQQDKQHHRVDETTSKVKRKISEQAARMDFMSRKAPKRGALELLQRTTTTTTNDITTHKSSSSSTEAAASRTATVNTSGVPKRSTTTTPCTSTTHGAQPNQQQHANAGNDNKRPRPSNWRINEFGLAVPTTPPTPTTGRFHATSSSSNQ